MESAARSDQSAIDDLTQEEWDAINARAQNLRGRARELLAAPPSTEIEWPEPENHARGGFARPGEILARVSQSGLFSRLSLVNENPYRPWDGPVDWSDCVARDDHDNGDDHEDPSTVIDLPNPGIDLREERIRIGAPRHLLSLARIRRNGVLA